MLDIEQAGECFSFIWWWRRVVVVWFSDVSVN